LRQVLHGAGALKRLPEVLSSVVEGKETARALIITGKSLATKTPVIKSIEGLLGKDGHAATFTDIGAHARAQVVSV
jgi:alcohol dehydrogenase class IV